MGNEKAVRPKEEQIRKWAFRSIVTTTSIKAGTIITQDMIWSKRPGTGIPSWRMDEIIGRRAIRDLPENIILSFEDLE